MTPKGYSRIKSLILDCTSHGYIVQNYKSAQLAKKVGVKRRWGDTRTHLEGGKKKRDYDDTHPAKMVPMSEMNHSAELKPRIPTPW